MKRILLSWSSGKDSAWSLHVLRQRAEYEVAGLLTTFNEAAGRVAMHAVRRELVEQQAAAAGLPLWAVPLPWPCSNEQYESLMAQTCAKAVSEGIEGVAFGDLFLEDVRAYREKQMKGTGLEPIFPVWGLPTRDLAQEMITSGVRAKLDLYRHKETRSVLRRPRVRSDVSFGATRWQWIPAANAESSTPLYTQGPC
jgi:diphthamide synthase (EF-2-diphthine--ammonia ligase)